MKKEYLFQAKICSILFSLYLDSVSTVSAYVLPEDVIV